VILDLFPGDYMARIFPLYIYALVAQFINASGEIAGFGVNASGQTQAFLATPCP
jgi:hypothetical protein